MSLNLGFLGATSSLVHIFPTGSAEISTTTEKHWERRRMGYNYIYKKKLGKAEGFTVGCLVVMWRLCAGKKSDEVVWVAVVIVSDGRRAVSYTAAKEKQNRQVVSGLEMFQRK